MPPRMKPKWIVYECPDCGHTEKVEYKEQEPELTRWEKGYALFHLCFILFFIVLIVYGALDKWVF